MTTWELRQGDVLDRLREMDDESVQCVVTSPPYWGLRDYGADGQIGLEATPEEHVEKMVEVFREVRRVLRGDGTCWLNYGDAYAASGPPGGQGKQQTNRGSFGVMNRKPSSGLKPKDLIGLPWRLAFALQADGWWLRSDIIWAKPNPMPESVTDRPTRAHEYVFLLTKAARYFYDADAVREPHTQAIKDGRENSGDWKSVGDRVKHGEDPRFRTRPGSRHPDYYGHPLGRNLRTVWTIPKQPYPKAHFATFPERLVEPCVRAGSRDGDIVLDPFAGSGTTGAVAVKLGRRFVGIELNSEYSKLAEERIDCAVRNLTASNAAPRKVRKRLGNEKENQAKRKTKRKTKRRGR